MEELGGRSRGDTDDEVLGDDRASELSESDSSFSSLTPPTTLSAFLCGNTAASASGGGSSSPDVTGDEELAVQRPSSPPNNPAGNSSVAGVPFQSGLSLTQALAILLRARGHSLLVLAAAGLHFTIAGLQFWG